jgi:hypothetical protein
MSPSPLIPTHGRISGGGGGGGGSSRLSKMIKIFATQHTPRDRARRWCRCNPKRLWFVSICTSGNDKFFCSLLTSLSMFQMDDAFLIISFYRFQIIESVSNLWRNVFLLFSRSIILELKVCIHVHCTGTSHFFCLMTIKRMNVNREEFAHISARMATSLPCQSGEECTGWQVICLHLPPPPPTTSHSRYLITHSQRVARIHGRHFLQNRHPRDTIGLYYLATGGYKEMSSTPSYTSPNAGGWGEGGIAGSKPMSTAVHITWLGAQINFGDLTAFLTYAFPGRYAVANSLGNFKLWGN